MKVLSFFTSVIVIGVLAYLWVVARVLVGTQEIEWMVWKSPYLKELILWLVIGIPLVLFFHGSSGDEEDKD